MNEELSAYTFDVHEKWFLNLIGSVGYKDQTADTGIWVPKPDKNLSQRSVGFQNSDQENYSDRSTIYE